MNNMHPPMQEMFGHLASVSCHTFLFIVCDFGHPWVFTWPLESICENSEREGKSLAALLAGQTQVG